MNYLNGISEEKFIKVRKKVIPMKAFTYRGDPLLKPRTPSNKKSASNIFKLSPETLLSLAVKVVDALPLPSVYTWTNAEVCTWIRQYGYPHYQNTFRVNHINGRTLLLLNASALSAINIKNFQDIRHIAYGIRCLFHFEMTKFLRSISLAPEYHFELYKLFRVKSGLYYEQTRRSDLWRQMHLLREQSPHLTHWDLLESWLAMEVHPKYPELFGGVRRRQLYKCKKAPKFESGGTVCNCLPPCECYWTKRDILLTN